MHSPHGVSVLGVVCTAIVPHRDLELDLNRVYVFEEICLGRVNLDKGLDHPLVLGVQISLSRRGREHDVKVGFLTLQPIPDLEILVLGLVREEHLQ